MTNSKIFWERAWAPLNTPPTVERGHPFPCAASIKSSLHTYKFTAIVPGAYPGEAKRCLRLIAETDAPSVGDSHPSC